MRLLVILILVVMLAGCSRGYYRRQADKETYHAIEERDHDPRWDLPHISIDPSPQSRLYDPYDPDHSPLPPDDPAAHRYMRWVNGIRGYRRWHKDGDAPYIEDPEWRNALPLSEDGLLELTPQRVVELGVLHSREYQTQLEDLYLSSLALTLNRFEFDLHWFGTNSTTFTHFGSSATESNTLNTTSSFGFTRALASGGQLMIDFANSFVFEFARLDHTIVSSNIIANLTKPLLRNAGRDFRLEGLTEAERTLLYQVRTFARFRKNFTFSLATESYLRLLMQEQQIRNERATLSSKEQNFRLHEALFAAGQVDAVRVDQALQTLQQAQAGLVNSEANFESALDVYKETLGLPPTLDIRLDDSLLAPFQLVDPELEKFQKELDLFLASYRELDQPPPLVKLEDGLKKLKLHHARTLRFLAEIEEELKRWQAQPPQPEEDKPQIARKQAAQQLLAKDLEEIRKELAALEKKIDKALPALTETKRQEGWEDLLAQTRDETAALAQLSIIQTQVHVFLIRLKSMNYEAAAAIDYALENRLDLMNQRAMVVDAWRKIAVAANQLRAGLDIVVNATIANPPGSGNPVDFRASASSYAVGVQFDSPLNRVAERNLYRASLISYQRARRAFMMLDDRIERDIRNDLRQLKAARLNFEIARQSLITAARQVEGARETLLLQGKAGDPASTLSVINALDAVLVAKNGLIGAWVNYETTRYRLLLDLEALQLDERGMYAHEYNDRTNQSGPPGSKPAKDQAGQASS